MELGLICYISGSILFIIVGLLHLYVHKIQLTSTETKNRIEKAGKIKVGKNNVAVWKLWKGMSLLFGFLILLIGIMNIISWYELKDIKSISRSICILNMILLILIIYSGKKYFGKMQVYGGTIGFILFLIALITT